MTPGVGLQQVQDRFLVHDFQFAVTAQAAREGTQRVRQIKACDDFADLFARFSGAHEITVGDNFVAQQGAITRQYDAPFATGELSDFRIGESIAINRIERSSRR